MTRLWRAAAAALAILCAQPLHAQTSSDVVSAINGSLPDNRRGAITAASLRSLLVLMAQSSPYLNADGTIAFPSGLRLGQIAGGKFTLTPDAMTGDASAASVTAGGQTQNLSAWLPTFVPKSGGTFSGGIIVPSLAVGRAADSASQWVNDNLPGAYATNRVQQFTISPNGGYSAVVHAARTSDNAGPADNVLTDTCLNVHDNSNIAHLNWCRYTQVNVKAGAKVSLALGEENSIENLSNISVAIDPFSNVGPGSGVTAALRLTSGVGRPANDISAYFQMINNGGAKAKSGIVFSSDALNTDSGYAPALALAPNQGISWYNGLTNQGWKIVQNSNAGTGSIVLGNNSFNLFIGSGTENPLSISPGQVYINDPVLLGGVMTLKQYAAATLPQCSSDVNRGAMAYITDAPTGYTYRQAVAGAGTGTTRAPVFCTGGQWEFH